jgi:Alcohol dehydrogenase GroES-like domain
MPCQYTFRKGLPIGGPSGFSGDVKPSGADLNPDLAPSWRSLARGTGAVVSGPLISRPRSRRALCVVLSCTALATFGLKTVRSQSFSRQPTRSSDCPRPVFAGQICGPYWGIDAVDGPRPMGHEYVGIVEEVGSAVATIRPGQFVVGSFWASDNTCEICRAGYQASCNQRVGMGRPKPSDCGCRWPTARWSRHPTCRPTI